MLPTSGLLAILTLVVGRESVLSAASSREVRCGRRLVSGLFSRPRLPLGYSHVATVPQGACRLNVSELLPSENYIALRVVNGSYIMNGEFAVSADGAYEAAGARFLYSRAAGKDHVYAHGPILQPIDIMILYQHSSPSIKYEYFTEPVSGEAEIDTGGTTSNVIPDLIPTTIPKHVLRHHNLDATYPKIAPPHRYPDIISASKEINKDELEIGHNVIGSRKFTWKIVSFGPCSRTCGGGIQLGKFRCVEKIESLGDKEVSPAHCGGPSPTIKRRRCGMVQCPPRWRAASWSTCPACGPARRTRIVGCVQDNTHGITKVNDQKCPAPKPSTSELCDIPDCIDKKLDYKPPDTRRQLLRPNEHTDTFREGPVYTVTVNNTDNEIGPEYNFSPAAGWLYTEWSECVGWCVGGGIKTRGVRCADPAGCETHLAPETSKPCKPQTTCGPLEGQWFTGEWSECSSACGGRQVRGALCIGGGGRRLRDDSCKASRPQTERECGQDCAPVWYFSEWGQCTGSCTPETTGISRRTVWCARGGGAGAADESQCTPPRPPAHRSCKRHCQTPLEPVGTSSTPIPIEAQRKVRDENNEPQENPQNDNTEAESADKEKECSDRLRNCALAVQARLCHYDYYTKNCCNSCKGR